MQAEFSRALVVTAGTVVSLTTPLNAQTFDQGTITTQRTALFDHVPSTGGWMSTQSTPRFWTWDLSSSITVGSEKSPHMNEWIHMMVPTDLVDSSGVVDWSGAQDFAEDIADRILAAGYQDGEYALFLQNWVRHTRLSQWGDDDLVPPVDSGSVPITWATGSYGRTTANTATPWRAEGLANTYDDYLAQFIISYVEYFVMNDPGSTYTAFPKPARVFFDEEFSYGHGCQIEPLSVLYAIANDARFGTEQLQGHYDLWDATPSSTTVSELFLDVDLCDITDWVPSTTYDAYSVMSPVPGSGCSGCQNVCLDYNYFPIINRFGGVLRSAQDGLIRTSFGDAIEATWGSKVLWSNYATSVWTTESYPMISKGDRGARDATDRDNDRFGYLQSAGMGSGGLQSPVLYPPFSEHTSDTCPDTATGCTAGAPETHAQAWVRTARTALDHAIFSLDEFDEIEDITGTPTPKRFAPWITAVGTTVHIPNETYLDTITTKANVRDVVALSKSRGVNEIIFWGHPTDGGHENGYQQDWEATNDLLSQVYDYNLDTVAVSSGHTMTQDDIDAMRYGEEHAFDIAPTSLVAAQVAALQATFSVADLSTMASSYAFVSEAIDGGGPWHGASYILSIYNYSTAQFETLSSPTELLSTSTRHAIFSDTDSDDLSDAFERVFDEQGDMPSGSLASDRKTINRWDFTLPLGSASLSDYADPSDGSMTFRLAATHTTQPSGGQAADPWRIDLIQLYETDAENDNLPYPEARTANGDLDGDGAVTHADLAAFRVDSPTSDLDSNGRTDAEDLRLLLQLILQND